MESVVTMMARKVNEIVSEGIAEKLSLIGGEGFHMHPPADENRNGFMTIQDRILLNNRTSAATPSTLMQRDSFGRAKVAAPSAADDIARKKEIDEVSNRVDRIIADGDSSAEVVDARGGYPVLSGRMNAIDAQFADMMYNVKKYGAKGDGYANDTAAIQAAIDAASAAGGGTVFFPKGKYNVTTTLKAKPSVNLKGLGMRFVSVIQWVSQSNGIILDTSNVDIRYVTYEDLCFCKAGTNAQVTGIMGGSDFATYNSAMAVFRSLMFYGIAYGIRGDAYKGVQDVGLFDCLFDNIWCDTCFYGLWFHGSGNTVVHPKITSCNIGMVLDWLSGESMTAVHVLGGVFASNGYDISIPNKNGIRPCAFYGTWLEANQHGVISIPNFDTNVMSLKFDNCLFNTYSTSSVASFAGALGAVTLDSCTISQVGTSSVTILPPVSTDAILKVKNSVQILNDGSRSILNYTKGSPWIKATLQNSWVHPADPGTITKYWKDDNGVVHLQIAMKDGVVTVGTICATLPSGYRPTQSVRFQIYDVTNNAVRNMYVDSNGSLVVGATGTTGVWAGYISYRAD